MNTFKRSSYLIISLLFLAVTLYISGCSSAESTTGKLAFNEKDYAKAETELKKGLVIDKNDAEGWYMLGYSQVKLGKYSDANESFKKSLAINNNYASNIQALWIEEYNAGVTNYNNAISSYKKGDTATSGRTFRTALGSLFAANAINSDSIKVAQLIGDSYFYMGKKDSALVYYTSVIDKSKSADDANQIARILYESGISAMTDKDYERAKDIFGKVSTLQYLPKDNKYYEVSVYNSALADYRIVEKMANENKPSSEYNPYLQSIITKLEPLVGSSKDKDLVKNSYEILIASYDALGMTDKSADAKAKQSALGN